MNNSHSITTDVAPASGLLSTGGSDLPQFNAAAHMAFTSAPATSMGGSTNPLTQQNDTYTVSKQQLERRY